MNSQGMSKMDTTEGVPRMFCTGCGGAMTGQFCNTCGKNNGAAPAQAPPAAVAPPASGNSMMMQQMMANQQAQNAAMLSSAAQGGGNQPNIINNNNNNNNNNTPYTNTGNIGVGMVYNTAQTQQYGANDGCSCIAGAWPGTDEHTRPLHITLLVFAILGVLINGYFCAAISSQVYRFPWGAVIGSLASLCALVGSSTFLGPKTNNCSCRRTPCVGQVVCWMMGISGTLSVASAAASFLIILTCRGWSCISVGTNAFELGLNLLVALFAWICLWKSLPTTNLIVFQMAHEV